MARKKVDYEGLGFKFYGTNTRVVEHLMELEEEDIKNQPIDEIRGMAHMLGSGSSRDPEIKNTIDFLVAVRRDRRWRS